MDIKDIFSQKIIELMEQKIGIKIESLPLETPPKKDMWDFCFWAFHFAKVLKKNPTEFVSEAKNILEESGIVSNISTSGPFINFNVPSSFFIEDLQNQYLKKDLISANKKAKNENIIVDYIGINVWKPMHIWHMCTPNIGQSLINLYKKMGYSVISDSHIWDWGIIFWKLITAIKIYGWEENLEKDAITYLFEMYVKITKDCEDNPELEERTREEFKMLSEWNEESIKIWEKVTKSSINSAKKQLSRMNVFPDYNIWESFYEGLSLPKVENFPDLKYTMNDIVSELIQKEIATKNEDNSVWVIFDGEKLPSCILEKRNWTKWYLASDLACIKYRMENWNPTKIIYCVDVRQKLHFEQAFEISKNAGWLNDKTELFHAYNWFISLKDWAISTRKWNIISLEALFDEAKERAKKIILEKRSDLNSDELEKLAENIWILAVKYGHISKNRTTDVIFDWDEFMSFDWKSGPYIAYNFVRANKILNDNELIEGDSDFYEIEKSETELIKFLWEYDFILNKTIESNSPHILANYAYEISKSFSTFYNAVRIDTKNQNEKSNRLKLTSLYKETVSDAMWILWIILPTKM